MSEHTCLPPAAGRPLDHGLYLHAETAGLGSTHDRLTALAPLPFNRTRSRAGRCLPCCSSSPRTCRRRHRSPIGCSHAATRVV